MPNDKKNFRLIVVKTENYNRLRQLGKTPDSFNTIISRLLNVYYDHNDRTRNNNIPLDQEAVLSK